METATILCIDDEEPGSKVRKLLLESVGYKVLLAHTGVEGIRIFESNLIDAVVLDYWMADMNGLAVARKLKAIKPLIPILMLSAYIQVLDEAVGLADVWVSKGEDDPEDLLIRLKNLLTRSKATKSE